MRRINHNDGRMIEGLHGLAHNHGGLLARGILMSLSSRVQLLQFSLQIGGFLIFFFGNGLLDRLLELVYL